MKTSERVLSLDGYTDNDVAMLKTGVPFERSTMVLYALAHPVLKHNVRIYEEPSPPETPRLLLMPTETAQPVVITGHPEVA